MRNPTPQASSGWGEVNVSYLVFRTKDSFIDERENAGPTMSSFASSLAGTSGPELPGPGSPCAFAVRAQGEVGSGAAGGGRVAMFRESALA